MTGLFRRFWLGLGIALLVTLAGCTMATKVHHLPISELGILSPAVQNQPVPDTAAYVTRFAGEDGVILSLNETIEQNGTLSSVFNSAFGWDYSYQQQRRYMILNPEATELSTLNFDYLPNNFYALVSAPSGVRRTYSMKDLIPVKITDKDTDYRLTLGGLVRGSVVSYGFEYTNSSYGNLRLDYSHWVQYRLPVESLVISFNYPNWWQLQVRETGNGVKQRTQTIPHSEANKLELRYEARSVPAYRSESYSPPEFWERPRLEYQLTSIETSNKWQRPTTWDSLFSELKDYTDKKSPVGNQTIAHLADSLLDGSRNMKETAVRVVEYVRHQIAEADKSYNGKLEAVVRDKKGDRFDRLALAIRLFREAHLFPRLYALTSVFSGPFDDTYISSEQIADFAVELRDTSDTLLVFPATSSVPIGHIPFWYRGQRAIRIERGDSGTFWTVPARTSLTDPEIFRDIHVQIDSSTGIAKVVEKATYLGGQAYYMRAAVLPRTGSNRVDSLRRFIGFYGADIRDYTLTVVNDSLIDLPLEIEYHYTVANLMASSGQERVLQLGDLINPSLSFVAGGRPDTLTRVHPFWIYSPSYTKRTITIDYPESWRLVTDIPPAEFVNDVGSLSTTAHQLNGQVLLEQHARLNQVRFPKNRLADFSDLISAGERSAVSALVFSESKIQ